MFLSAVPLILGGTALAEERLASRGVTLEPTDGEAVVAGLSCCAAVILMPAVVASWVGLFRRRWWAPWAYLGTTVATKVFALATGAVGFAYEWGLPGAVGGASDVVTGVVIGLVFFSPAAADYVHPPDASARTP
ncbi:hypothetical protein [Fimbriiglobus ruber]|uniref:Uncharacterized protein n=1 Tax=Fimbriiglobus ruber TaxID=1908690 RepID=A0A225DDQ1_9BACT|nr:hypothetical protein [Fimbriiglobus ruber]OWK35279.1 hypothetical protein FRUB_09440 [Fimbriiglobus ruber]